MWPNYLMAMLLSQRSLKRMPNPTILKPRLNELLCPPRQGGSA